MKKIFFLIVYLAFTVSVKAQDTSTNKKMQFPQAEGKKYCAMLKDGKMSLMVDGKTVNADISFANGAKVTTEGILKKKDGSETVLKNGECIDANGEIIPDEKSKIQDHKKEDIKKVR